MKKCVFEKVYDPLLWKLACVSLKFIPICLVKGIYKEFESCFFFCCFFFFIDCCFEVLHHHFISFLASDVSV